MCTFEDPLLWRPLETQEIKGSQHYHDSSYQNTGKDRGNVHIIKLQKMVQCIREQTEKLNSAIDSLYWIRRQQ